MKSKSKLLTEKRKSLKIRIRKKISGSSEKPRLVVYRGLRNIIAQLNDDVNNITILYIGGNF